MKGRCRSPLKHLRPTCIVSESEIKKGSEMRPIPEKVMSYAKQPSIRHLHNQLSNPLCILKGMIFDFFSPQYQTIAEGIEIANRFQLVSNPNTIVSIYECFDALNIPTDHPSRRESDTFYIDENHVLQTHTSAHQHRLLKSGSGQFLVAGPCFRRDEIDRNHNNIFHQIEGVKLCENAEDDLKDTLTRLMQSIIPGVECRFSDDYFPFTYPSFEMNILWNGQWLEILGCGVIHEKVLQNVGIKNKTGWAFGLGLERLAMVLFDIPDIRLFWSKDERFTKQFTKGEVVKFEPFSNQPPVCRDIAFWQTELVDINMLCELISNIAGELIEEVKLLDTFDKGGRTSTCYRMVFRAVDRSLTNEEINQLNETIRTEVAQQFGVEIR